MNLVIQFETVEDVDEAYHWYARQHVATGARFRVAFDEAVAKALEHPDGYEVLYRETRRVLLRRFPYGIYYRLAGDTLVVIACLHLRRAPRTWRARS